MLLQNEIQVGLEVEYKIQPDSTMHYLAYIPAKVTKLLEDDKAEIRIHGLNMGEFYTKVVPISELLYPLATISEDKIYEGYKVYAKRAKVLSRDEIKACGGCFDPISDTYYNSIDDYLERVSVSGEKLEDFVFAVKTIEPIGLSADWIVEVGYCDVTDGLDFDKMKGLDDLQLALDDFHRVNKERLSYLEPDFNKVYFFE